MTTHLGDHVFCKKCIDDSELKSTKYRQQLQVGVSSSTSSSNKKPAILKLRCKFGGCKEIRIIKQVGPAASRSLDCPFNRRRGERKKFVAPTVRQVRRQEKLRRLRFWVMAWDRKFRNTPLTPPSADSSLSSDYEDNEEGSSSDEDDPYEFLPLPSPPALKLPPGKREWDLGSLIRQSPCYYNQPTP